MIFMRVVYWRGTGRLGGARASHRDRSGLGASVPGWSTRPAAERYTSPMKLRTRLNLIVAGLTATFVIVLIFAEIEDTRSSVSEEVEAAKADAMMVGRLAAGQGLQAAEAERRAPNASARKGEADDGL